MQEVRRAGDYTISTDALQLFAWELQGAIIRSLNMLLDATAADFGAAISEKGVLQLLFDQRLIRDFLVGARPVLITSSGESMNGTLTSESVSNGLDEVSSSSRQFSRSAGAFGGSGHHKLDASDPHTQAAMAERRKLVAALEQQLQVGPCGLGCHPGDQTASKCAADVQQYIVNPRIAAWAADLLHAAGRELCGAVAV